MPHTRDLTLSKHLDAAHGRIRAECLTLVFVMSRLDPVGPVAARATADGLTEGLVVYNRVTPTLAFQHRSNVTTS
eukprot:365252-Chlamydomonas_euryale.AAC.36